MRPGFRSLKNESLTDSQKSILAGSIQNALSRWQARTVFVDPARIEIDNNTVERAIRPLALNRRNALFAGSDGGAEQSAVLATLIETTKLNAIDPHSYLTDAITRIIWGHPPSLIDALMPSNYAVHYPTVRVVAPSLKP